MSGHPHGANLEPTLATDDERLNEALEQPKNYVSQRGGDTAGQYAQGSSPSSYPQTSSQEVIEFRQWQVGANDTFRPAGITRETLPAGVYTFGADERGVFLVKIRVIADSLKVLPDTANDHVLNAMVKFWASQDRYRAHKLIHKRGILLWGPPGSGKTATLTLLSQLLIADNGIVILGSHPEIDSAGMAALRRIEPERKIICILEDIDEIISKYGEHRLLALLDGENQVDNIVYIATTNHPQDLGARIVNRPARFDERIYVGMPGANARRQYLQHVAPKLPTSDLDIWVRDTDNLSIAHLRELAAAVICLEQSYDSVLARLRTMKQKVSNNESETVGFMR